jgi:hypothetical protein
VIASSGAVVAVNSQRSANDIADMERLIASYDSPGDAMPSGT